MYCRLLLIVVHYLAAIKLVAQKLKPIMRLIKNIRQQLPNYLIFLCFKAVIMYRWNFIILMSGLLVLSVFTQAQPSFQKEVLEEMIAFNKKMKSDRLMVSIDNKLVADETFRGKPDDKFVIYSITKIFSGIAVGILIDQRIIDNPEVPVAAFFSEWKQDTLKSKITIRHILQHTSGLYTQNGSMDIYPQADFVQYALSSPVVTEPGYVFKYNNRAINIISGIVRRVTGESLEAFINKHLFVPLGIEDYEWKQDKAGNTWGMDGLWLTASDLLKVGQVLSNNGLWNGNRILSEKWCKLMYQLPLLNCYNGRFGYAMSIRSLPFQEEIAITTATLDSLSLHGLNDALLTKLNLLAKGGVYSYSKLKERLQMDFSANEIEALSAFAYRHLIPIYTVTNGNFFIMHGGEYGLLLAAFPRQKKVLVRFLGEKWGRQTKPDGSGYKYFIDDELVNYMLNL
jgi:CubicO group peptidase (beta-lactamase class C family)